VKSIAQEASGTSSSWPKVRILYPRDWEATPIFCQEYLSAPSLLALTRQSNCQDVYMNLQKIEGLFQEKGLYSAAKVIRSLS
jgi:hypothetical protein